MDPFKKGDLDLNMKTNDAAPTSSTFDHPPPQDRAHGISRPPITTIVTTSWDDGDPHDLRVAELLAARKLPGTFYIPVKGHVKSHHRYQRMSPAQMRELDCHGFEIGGHGVAAPNLPSCNQEQLIVEVEGCKKCLEDDLGKRVAMFAYPRGRHNKKVIASLKSAGYAGARTTAMMALDLDFDPFRMPTSVHVFPHSRIDYLRNLVRVWNLGRTWVYATHLRCGNNWVEFAKLTFDCVLADGGLWHLFGHSWEIDELRLWDGLAEVLEYVSQRPGVRYLANGPIVNLQATRTLAECRSTSASGHAGDTEGIQSTRERQVGVYKESWQ